MGRVGKRHNYRFIGYDDMIHLYLHCGSRISVIPSSTWMCAFFPHRIVTQHTTQPEKKKKHHQQNESRRCPTNVCLGTWFYSTFTLFIPFNQGPPRVFPLSLRHVRLRHLAESCGLEIEGLEERERFPPGGVVKTWEFFERETLKQQRSFLKLHKTPRNAGIF